MGSSKGKKDVNFGLSAFTVCCRSPFCATMPHLRKNWGGGGGGAARKCGQTLPQDNAWVWLVSLQIRSPLVGFLGLRSKCFFNSTRYDSHLS